MDSLKDARETQAMIARLSDKERADLAVSMASSGSISLEHAESLVGKAAAGEIVPELEKLYREHADLSKEIKRLEILAGVHVPPDRPWMMALEMQFAAIRLHSMLTTQSDLVGKGLTVQVIGHLKRADAYAWTSETSAAAWLASQSIPEDSRASVAMLPGSAGWWWFDSPPPVRVEAKNGLGPCALLWAVEDKGIVLTAFAWTDTGPMMAISWTWLHDQAWADMKADLEAQEFLLIKQGDIPPAEGRAAVAAISRFFLAGCVWLQQRVIASSVGHVERHRRKQLARENNVTDVQREIRVIQLRRTESNHHAQSGERDAASVEWSCRWIVNGHWRNQFYSKTGDHKLIYIMPFVKGPSDMPLKTATHTVYEVRR